MIPLIKEPEEFYKNTHVYEHCFFCNEPTDTWHEKTNQPVCKKCSKKFKV
jgi:hypothetical protein